jgi:hypothetical protein
MCKKIIAFVEIVGELRGLPGYIFECWGELNFPNILHV